MKLKQFQNYIREQSIDVVCLIHPDINITYFTQFKPSYSFLLIYPQSTHLYLTSLDKSPLLDKNITLNKFNTNWESKIGNAKYHKVGINKGSITLSSYEKLKKLFPKAEFIDVANKLNELRSQKTDKEIEIINKGCKISDKCISELVDEMSKKMDHFSELYLSNRLEQKFKNYNCFSSFPIIIASGKNSSIPHHQTSKQKIRNGFLLIDFGVNYKNYCTDTTRTFYVGKPTKVEKDIYSILKSSQEETINQIVENKPFIELDNFARKKLGKYSSQFTHSLGHGVGLEIHEDPSFSKDKKMIIKNNQIFTIEPGIYLKKYGLRIEDTILFNKKPVILTRNPKELICF